MLKFSGERLPAAAKPSGVISLDLISRLTFSLFISDKGLFGRRGVNLRALLSSSIFLTVLSIQPKHG